MWRLLLLCREHRSSWTGDVYTSGRWRPVIPGRARVGPSVVDTIGLRPTTKYAIGPTMLTAERSAHTHRGPLTSSAERLRKSLRTAAMSASWRTAPSVFLWAGPTSFPRREHRADRLAGQRPLDPGCGSATGDDRGIGFPPAVARPLREPARPNEGRTSRCWSGAPEGARPGVPRRPWHGFVGWASGSPGLKHSDSASAARRDQSARAWLPCAEPRVPFARDRCPQTTGAPAEPPGRSEAKEAVGGRQEAGDEFAGPAGALCKTGDRPSLWSKEGSVRVDVRLSRATIAPVGRDQAWTATTCRRRGGRGSAWRAARSDCRSPGRKHISAISAPVREGRRMLTSRNAGSSRFRHEPDAPLRGRPVPHAGSRASRPHRTGTGS